MRIGLRLFYNPSWMGGVNYVLNIARMLRFLPDAERPHITFLTSAPQAVEIAQAHADLADDIAEFSQARSLDLDFVYPSTQLPEAPFGAPWAGWIPDWQCQHHPDLFPDEEKARRFLQYRELARRPAACVFSSQQAYDDTAKLFPDFNRDHWRIFHFPAVFDDSVWRMPEEDIAETRVRFGIPVRYLIVCNQFWKHKNHLQVVQALAERPDLDVHVVMTGAIEDSRWPDYADRIKSILSQPEVARRVTVTDRISRAEQLKLLLGASGYIQPSRFEGWSTFVEEARALGLPGLLSDIPVHREQSPEGCRFFDADNVHSLCDALETFQRDQPARPELAVAKTRQDAYVAACARTFLDIAAMVRAEYVRDRHDTAAILARAIPALFDEIGKSAYCTQGSFDRWLANTRLLLREHPEDLARVSGRICSEEPAFSQHAPNLLVLATLAKCAPATRKRFMDFEPDDDNPAVAQNIKSMQSSVGSTDMQARLALKNALFRLKDYVGRKLAE